MRSAGYLFEYGQIVAEEGNLSEGFKENHDRTYLTDRAVAVVRRSLNRDVDKRIADKAWHAMKEMNIPLIQIVIDFQVWWTDGSQDLFLLI